MKCIYHTSHCGSTLLSALLATAHTQVYAEPPAAHDAIATGRATLQLDLPRDAVVKLPSGLCHTATQDADRKVFLYRNLGEHLLVMFRNRTYTRDYPAHYMDYMRRFRHPSLAAFPTATLEQQHVFMWLNRIHWLREASNVKWVRTRDFFSAATQATVVDDICDFFDLTRVTDYGVAAIDVKRAGLMHGDTPLDLKSIRHSDVPAPRNGLVDDAEVRCDPVVWTLVQWITSKFPALVDDLI